MVKQELVESVMEICRWCPSIISVDLALFRELITIISVYAPQCERSKEEKEKFFDDLTAKM